MLLLFLFFLFFFFVCFCFFYLFFFFFFFQAEDGIRDVAVTGVQTCALPICFTQSKAIGSGDILKIASGSLTITAA